MAINSVSISGNITRQPDLRMTQSGTNILSFGVAVNERVKNRTTGEWEDYANFIDCVMFGSRAAALSKILAKGSKVAVSGKLRYSSWERDGQRRSKVEVIADEVDIMQRAGRREGEQQGQQANYSQNGNYAPNSASQAPQDGYYQQPQAPVSDVYDEEVPFDGAAA